MGNSISPSDYQMLLQKTQEASMTVLAIALVISALGCFFGYKLMKIYIAICGFLLGFLAGVFIGIVSDTPLIIFPAGLVLGIILAIVAYKLYKVGVFLTSFFTVGLFATGIVFAIMGQDPNKYAIPLAVGVIAGIVAGVIAVIFTKPVIIISTSLSYGSSCGTLLAMMISHPKLRIVLGIIFFVLGLIVQIKTNDGLLEKPESTPASQNYAPPQYVNPYAMPGQPNSQYGPIGQQQDQNYDDFLGSKR